MEGDRGRVSLSRWRYSFSHYPPKMKWKSVLVYTSEATDLKKFPFKTKEIFVRREILLLIQSQSGTKVRMRSS